MQLNEEYGVQQWAVGKVRRRRTVQRFLDQPSFLNYTRSAVRSLIGDIFTTAQFEIEMGRSILDRLKASQMDSWKSELDAVAKF